METSTFLVSSTIPKVGIPEVGASQVWIAPFSLKILLNDLLALICIVRFMLWCAVWVPPWPSLLQL